MVPLIGAREATVLGGAIITAITLLTAWRIPELMKFRLGRTGERSEGEAIEKERSASG